MSHTTFSPSLNSYLGGGKYQISNWIQKASVTRPWVVLVANDVRTHQKVLIKQVNPVGFASTTEWQVQRAHEMLLREAELLRSIHDHRIPRLLDFFYEDQYLALVLHYFEGQTLEKYLEGQNAKRVCTQDEVIDFGIQMCAIFSYIHSLHPPVLHRDLKPGNIVRNMHGYYALIDFGNGRRFGSHTSLLDAARWKSTPWDTIQGIGSPGYASPEQYPVPSALYPTGYKPIRTTPASDLYPLGVIMHEMLTGKNPSQKEEHAMFAHTSLDGYAHPDLVLLIKHLLHVDPSARPRSAYIVMQCLVNIQRDRRKRSHRFGTSTGRSVDPEPSTFSHVQCF